MSVTRSSRPPLIDEVLLGETLRVLIPAGQVTEVRALDAKMPCVGYPRTISGYFNDPAALIKAVCTLTSAKGIYLIPNRVAPALLARAANRILAIYKEPLTSDADITARRWLLIDADAVRPAGISATDTEHEAALEVASHVRDHLSADGWPDGVLADSGNGGHVLYRIELPADDDGLVERCLGALAARFDTPDVKIDGTVHNPARIWKLYGTLACKGDHTADRPHRMSRILEAPDEVHPVPHDLLEALAGSTSTSGPRSTVSVRTSTNGEFDLERWIAESGLKVAGPDPWRGGRRWVFATCPWNGDHTDRSAYIVQLANGSIGAGCHHNGCSGKGWHDLRDAVEPGWREKRHAKSPPMGALLSHMSLLSQGDTVQTDDVWPDPPADAAYHGLAGEIVRAIEPHSEADPVALLVQLLVAFGSVIGRCAHFLAEADCHFTNLFAAFVGRTSKGRKGSSWSQVRRFFQFVDEDWVTSRIAGGLSSGEGLIWAVRDPIYKSVKDKKTGEYVDECVDGGVADKRLLVMEAEFGSVLRVINRERNTLSAIIRLAWDSGDLQTMTKNSPARATGAHISIIGHITRDELRRHITETDMANGLANRFLWLCVRRSKCLPDGGSLNDDQVAELARRLRDAVEYARILDVIHRTEDARAVWRDVYPALSEGVAGLLGAVTSRAEAQVMRLATLYALLDHSPDIDVVHLKAALALWEYAEASARYVFGSSLGDPTADEINRALRVHPSGMSRTEIRDLFDKHKSAAEVVRALGVLAEHGLARSQTEKTGGRTAERWFSCT